MGTIAATPASGSTSSIAAPTESAASTIATQSFTGISNYSSDFQAILQRQDAISQLPITALQNTESTNLEMKQALIALNPVVGSLATSVSALGQLASGLGLTATSSDSSTVSVANTGATAPGNYAISNITVGTAASELSLTGYANASTTPLGIEGQNNFTLTVGSQTYNLNLDGNDNLTGLENAINNSGAPVSASILSSGTSNYLSVTANNVGATTLTLDTAPETADLITNNGTGTETSVAGYPDSGTTAVSGSGIVNLTVGSGAAIQLNISANNNLTGLMNAINSAGAGVTASISTSGGENYLKVVAAGGATPITLNDTPAAMPVNLISGSNQGADSSFTLNNSIQVTNQTTNVFSSVIPGVTFTLLQNNPGSVSLSLATDPAQLTSALQTFVTNYNALADQVTQETGTGAGPLGGDSTIRDISDDLSQLSGYFASSSSTVRSLSDLGITFDDSGQMSLDPTVIAGFSDTQLSDAFKFLGSSNSGFASFASNFTMISDPVTGIIQNEENGLDTDDTNIGSEISTLQTRATLTHNAESAKLEAADALVAQLESDQNTVNAEVESVDFVDFGAPLTNSSGG
jgi:flagellar hook-associated protein 2